MKITTRSLWFRELNPEPLSEILSPELWFFFLTFIQFCPDCSVNDINSYYCVVLHLPVHSILFVKNLDAQNTLARVQGQIMKTPVSLQEDEIFN